MYDSTNLAVAPELGEVSRVAFTDVGRVAQLHVWARSPAGMPPRLTDLGTTSSIDTLADNGEVHVAQRRDAVPQSRCPAGRDQLG